MTDAKPVGSGEAAPSLAALLTLLREAAHLYQESDDPRSGVEFTAEYLATRGVSVGRVSADAPSPESQPYFDYDEVHGAGSVSRGVPEPSRDKMRAVLNWARDIETLLAAIFSESDDDRPAADTKVLYDGLADVRRELKAAVAAVDFGGSLDA